ncbi:hypothetical protein RRG08_049406 [Elysia crispata]|uniref:Uncharacterized protein n=1 Tax=Elysia crispata TaxID=231223 RepID=A0AAE0XDY2_9GAST|nr:hypothetical protein RRG08_049406 [Elysia crispata]
MISVVRCKCKSHHTSTASLAELCGSTGDCGVRAFGLIFVISVEVLWRPEHSRSETQTGRIRKARTASRGDHSTEAGRGMMAGPEIEGKIKKQG